MTIVSRHFGTTFAFGKRAQIVFTQIIAALLGYSFCSGFFIFGQQVVLRSSPGINF